MRALQLCLLGLFLVACSGKKLPSPMDGQLTRLTYSNGFFGFSVSLPEQWSPVAKSEWSGMSASTKSRNVNLLLMGVPQKFTRFVICEQPLTSTRRTYTGAQALEWIEETRKPTDPPLERVRGINPVVLTGQQFYRIQFRTPRGDSIFHQVYYATVLDRHALVLFFTAPDEERLLEIEGIVKTVQFKT